MFLIEDLSYDWRPTNNIRFDYIVRAVVSHASVCRASSISYKCENWCECSRGRWDCLLCVLCVYAVRFSGFVVASHVRSVIRLTQNEFAGTVFLFVSGLFWFAEHRFRQHNTSIRSATLYVCYVYTCIACICGNRCILESGAKQSIHINEFINKFISLRRKSTWCNPVPIYTHTLHIKVTRELWLLRNAWILAIQLYGSA